jgi:CheY-like chemotaxis protein/HPt (histidine-containing phosphotransfer) domain-containing protein
MSFSEEEVKEFKMEAEELLDNAEKSLLAIDQGAPFKTHYDAVFRAFHSIKGAAGMMELVALQTHMHHLENILTQEQKQSELRKELIDLFLRGIDAARQLLNDQGISFSYEFESNESTHDNAWDYVETEEAKEIFALGSNDPIRNELTSVSPSEATVTQSPGETKVNVASVTKLPVKPVIQGKVLIVDDEPDIIDLLTMIIEDCGFQVVSTTNPLSVMELIESQNPDVIFSDFKMPEKTGLEIMGEVNQLNSNLPFVLISGFVDKELLIESLNFGVYAVLEKPFDMKRVIEVCTNGVKRYQLWKLFNRSLNLVMYQFSDVDDFLKSQGKEEVRKVLKTELQGLIECRRELSILIKKKVS